MHGAWLIAAAAFVVSKLLVAERPAAGHFALITSCVVSFNWLVCLLWSLSQPRVVQKIVFDLLRLRADLLGVSMADKGVCF